MRLGAQTNEDDGVMIIIKVPFELGEYPKLSDEELTAARGSGVEVLKYDGPSDIQLPDFGDSVTRGVYSGMIKSFMPPPSHSYRVLCQIDLPSLEVLQEAQIDNWLEAIGQLIAAEIRFTYGNRDIIIVTFGRVVVYLLPQALSAYNLRSLGTRIEECVSQQDKLVDLSSYGFLGALASVFICYHCFFDGSEFFFLGPGPPPNQMK